MKSIIFIIVTWLSIYGGYATTGVFDELHNVRKK